MPHPAQEGPCRAGEAPTRLGLALRCRPLSARRRRLRNREQSIPDPRPENPRRRLPPLSSPADIDFRRQMHLAASCSIAWGLCRLTTDWHTLDMLGSPNGQQAVAGLCAAFADHVVETVRRRAEIHGRLTRHCCWRLTRHRTLRPPFPNLDQLMSTEAAQGSAPCSSCSPSTMPQHPGLGREALLRDLAT